MAYQLVYTSAPKLLDAGRSGFGTVARSKSISSLVVSTIERASQFANLRGLDRSRVIYVHRRVTAGSNRVHVLTRIIDAGVDYTGRTNHIAHHLVVSDAEAKKAAMRGVTPADILRQFPWLDRWEGSARFLDDSEDIPLDIFRPDGKNSRGNYWSSITGNSNHAKLLAWNAAPKTGVLIVPMDANPLSIMAEALAEFGDQSWSRSFSTSLETTDELSDLDWIISTNKAYPDIQSRCGSRNVWDLNHPTSLPTPPSTTPARQQLPHKSVEPSHPYIAEPNPIYAPPSELDTYDFPKQSFESAETENQSRRSIRKAKKQNKNLQALALCVAMLAALVIAAMFYLPMKSGQSSNSPKPKQVTSEEDKVINELKEKGLRKDKAEEMVMALSAEQAKKFVPYIDNFISRVFNSSDPNELKLLHHKNAMNSNNPNWLNELINANNSICEFVNNENSSNINLAADLKKIDKIASELEKVTEHIELSGDKSRYLNDFGRKMARFPLVIVFQKDNGLIESELINAIKYENTKEKGKREILNFDWMDYSIVCKLARKEEGEIKNSILPRIKKQFEEKEIPSKSPPPKDIIKEAPENQKNPKVKTEPTDITKEENKNQTKEKIDTTGLKKWQINLIKDASEIQEVVIPILQCMLKKNTNQLTPDGNLEINIDGKSYSEFYKDSEESFYCDNVLDPSIRISKKDKKISLKKDKNIQTIRISLNTSHSNSVHHHIVALDHHSAPKNKNPLIEDGLTFILTPISDDEVKFEGDAGEVINQLGDQKLKFYSGDNFLEGGFCGLSNEPEFINGFWVIKRKPQFKPVITLNSERISDIEKALKSFSRENGKKIGDMSKELYEAIEKSIGYHFLEKEGLLAISEKTVLEKIKSKFKINNEINEQNALILVGRNKTPDAYKKIMKTSNEWENMNDLAKDEIIKNVRLFIERTKQPETRQSFYEYLAPLIADITVKTENRTLFTAKLKK